MIRYFLWLVLVVGAFGQDGSITVTVGRPLVLPPDQLTFNLNVTTTGDKTLDDVLASLGDLGVRAEDLVGITIPQVAVKQDQPSVPLLLTIFQFRFTAQGKEGWETWTKIDRLRESVPGLSLRRVDFGVSDAAREKARMALYPELMVSARASAEEKAAAVGRRLVGVTGVREANVIPELRAGDFTSNTSSLVRDDLEQVGITVQFQSR